VDLGNYVVGKAWDWTYNSYTPFVAGLGLLNKVVITTHIDVSEIDPHDTFQFRLALFTGWSPDQYQFYDAETRSDVAGPFRIDETFTITDPGRLDPFIHPLYYPPLANFYFETITLNDGHTVSSTTELQYIFSPEPSTAVLWSLGGILGALALRRTRQVGRDSSSPGLSP